MVIGTKQNTIFHGVDGSVVIPVDDMVGL